ncbi:MAG: tRNA lysidine(34) synthetase TilS, partial [Candidatus Methylomirabilaceae bacterium]
MRDVVLNKVRQTIDRHRMLTPGETVIIAVSGGVDSMVLMRVLLALRERYRVSLHVAHLNHGLRGAESADAAEFVRGQCALHGVPATIRAIDGATLRTRRGGSLQDAARDARYGFLDRVADGAGATRIAMGHHRDDQAETILMNLLRGSGTAGLGAIPPVRGRIIRPLIECPRDGIERYALREGIAYVVDPSNRLPSYRRNRIRLELLPELAKQYNPRVAEALASAAMILEAEDALLATMTEEQLASAVMLRSDHEVVLSIPRTAAFPAGLRRRILRRGVQLLGGDRRGLGSRQTLALERLLLSDKAEGTLHLSGGLRATKAGDRLKLSVRQDVPPEAGRSTRLAVPGQTDLPAFGLRLTTDLLERKTGSGTASDRWTAWLDADRAGSELTVRSWESGDRFVPLGMRGSKKLQD